MKIVNAIKKLQKAGYVVNENHGRFSANKIDQRYVVEFSKNGASEEICCVGYRRCDDVSDPMTDYCATFFCDNLSQAIRRAESK